MHVLVTGGAGFIGSQVSAQLLRRGDRVTIVDDLNPFYDPRIKLENLRDLESVGDYAFHQVDIRDAAALGEVFLHSRFDAVIHLAAMAGVRPSIENPALYVSVNLTGTTHLLDLAVRHGPIPFVLASSSSVYGNNRVVPFHEDHPVDHPISPYAATKKAGEVLAHAYHHVHGLPVTALRFFTVYGPGQRPEMAIHRFTELIESGQPVPFFGDGSTRRDYTYIDDVVDGVLSAVDRCAGYRIYNLGESATTTLERLVTLIESALGKSAVLDRLPLQAGDVAETYADIERARRELGYAPRVPVEEGIPRFVRWYRERHS